MSSAESNALAITDGMDGIDQRESLGELGIRPQACPLNRSIDRSIDHHSEKTRRNTRDTRQTCEGSRHDSSDDLRDHEQDIQNEGEIHEILNPTLLSPAFQSQFLPTLPGGHERIQHPMHLLESVQEFVHVCVVFPDTRVLDLRELGFRDPLREEFRERCDQSTHPTLPSSLSLIFLLLLCIGDSGRGRRR